MAGMDHRLRHLLVEASERRLSRRELGKRGAAVGLSASGIGAALAVGPGASRRAGAQAETTLRFAHDKAPWDEWYQEMGQLSVEATGIGLEVTPFADTSTYQ